MNEPVLDEVRRLRQENEQLRHQLAQKAWTDDETPEPHKPPGFVRGVHRSIQAEIIYP